MSISTYSVPLGGPQYDSLEAAHQGIKEITQTRVHYGYRRVHVMLQREGHKDNGTQHG